MITPGRSLRTTLVSLLPAALLAASAHAALAQSVVFQGQTFVNKGLVGVARVPSNATDKIGDTVSLGSGMTVPPGGVLNASITPVAYKKFLDINDAAQLAKFGLHNGAPNDANNLNEKWESIAVLPVFDKQNPNDYFLEVAADNDFITQDGHMQGKPYADAPGVNNDTLVLVYRVTLPTYQAPANQ